MNRTTTRRKLSKKSRPILPYRMRGIVGMSDREFEEITDKTLEAFDLMEMNAHEDAKALLEALPDFDKLDAIDTIEGKRCAAAYLVMRVMDVFLQKANPFSLIEVIEIVLRDTQSARALIKHAPHTRAKLFVQSEWMKHREAYKGNKSEFARVYVGLVRNQFKDAKGDPLAVTEKTIREVWLSDPPSAGRPAGQPVAG